MGLPSFLPLGIHKGHLGAVWNEVLLELREIVEVMREDENMDVCGPGGGGELLCSSGLLYKGHL
jgi:hypothetical protein